jgi:hypothetical protein
MMHRPALVVLIALTASATGCASAFKTTPAQDRIYTVFEQCKKETSAGTAHLDYVSPDGQARYSAREGDLQRMQQCMNAKDKRMRWQ